MNIIFSGYSLIKNGKKIYKGLNALKKYKDLNNTIYMDLVSSSAKKERSDMILEPLQVMLQLALLSHCPIGTKVSVSNNILHLQQPTLLQGAWRWYNCDGKDDFFYGDGNSLVLRGDILPQPRSTHRFASSGNPGEF